ncbi:MAG TPA: DUF5103 domain-containing protein [Candidatus Kapabacteria bacterium]|nr:DUF5103 domain-containing protein [Candidatus Kapabacteria bacterium]
MKAIGISYTLLVLLAGSLIGQEAKFDPKHDALLRCVRIYGDNETLPPVLVLNNSSGYSTNIGSEKITVELDIFANVPPNLYARFVHCTADWKETENIFYQELYHRRFSNIRWDVAGYTNPYFSHRGYFTFPDFSIPIKYSGNWKVKFYSYDDDKEEFAEAKFFVVEPRAQASMSIWNSMYSTKYNVSSTSYNFDVQVWSKLNLLDNNVHTCVLYKNNRWEEPLVITDRNDIDDYSFLYKYKYRRSISGFIGARKFFRIEGVPAENEYRVLDLTNLGYFPRGVVEQRLPLSDLRRNGTFNEYDNEGMMITSRVPNYANDYIYLEFLLEPDGVITNEDVFIIGTFNNWKPDFRWIMHFDEADRYYKLRAWVRRGVHNYLYATGEFDFYRNRAVRYSTDQYEGNTSVNDHSFLAFVYYKDVAFGGYDAIIAATRQSISRSY